MSLQIGDISKLLNLSAETIRFYESQGIVRPVRKKGGAYRSYDSWDVFFLMDCLKYRSFGIPIREVAKMLHSESVWYCTDVIRKRQAQLEREIGDRILLQSGIKKYRESIETIPLNQGLFWFKTIPEQLYHVYLTTHGDDYGDIDPDDGTFSRWLDYFPFVEYGVHISVEDIENRAPLWTRWSLLVEKRYADILKMPIPADVHRTGERICLCTVLDIGERGSLKHDLFRPMLDRLGRNGCRADGEITGKLLARVHDGLKFCRYVEMQIPVEVK